MRLVYTPSTQLVERSNFIKLSNGFLLVGTVTFSGSYAAGGDTFTTGKSLEDLFKTIGAGRVIAALAAIRGYTPEWDSTAKKMKLFSGGTELTAGAYPAALTASPAPAVFLGR